MASLALGRFALLPMATMLFTGIVCAAEADFYIAFTACKNLVGPMTLSDDPLRTVEGDSSTFACTRRGAKISCDVSFAGGKQGVKGNLGEYEVNIDTPPVLAFRLVKGTEQIYVNTSEHAAVMSSLVLHEKFAGSKVCHGMYMTSFEFKAFSKK